MLRCPSLHVLRSQSSVGELLNCRFVSYLRCVAAQLLVACGRLMYVFEMCYLASMDAFMLVTSVAV